MTPQQLDATFAALADPTRRAIITRLARGEATLTELAKPFDMTQPAVAKHIGVLVRAGLITRGRDAQSRPCRLDTKRLASAMEWMDRQKRIWDARFDRLDEFLEELKTKEQKQHGRK